MNRPAMRSLSKTSRGARRDREAFLVKRRAAVAAWRKAEKEFARLAARVHVELDKAAVRFAELDRAIEALNELAAADSATLNDTPLERFESMRGDIESALEPPSFEAEIDATKGARLL